MADRVQLARAAYESALGAARAAPTPASWTRLLRCARNLRAVTHEWAAACHAELAARTAPLTWRALPRPDGGLDTVTDSSLAELEREIQRARQLRRRSRALREQSRALRASAEKVRSASVQLCQVCAASLGAREGGTLEPVRSRATRHGPS
jgi:hypothetical protein